jgi:2,3-bisphosphoglycerate-independent phosphoglycerate mutase
MPKLRSWMSSPRKKVCDMLITCDSESMFDLCYVLLHVRTQNKGQYVTLDASGLAVGLPDGLMGNSEVGHLNIGAGRVIYQDIVRINMDVESKAIHQNANFVRACERAKKESSGRLHLLGLVSDGGVHGHIRHLCSLVEGAKANGVPHVYIHFFADGRDTSPTSGVTYLQQLLDHLKALSFGKLSTITGRYYAMDRDKRWERIQIAYEALVSGKGEATTPEAVVDLVRSRYARAEDPQTDEFLTPIIVDSEGCIRDHDTLLFFNYRADRMRQINEALGLKPAFTPERVPTDLQLFSMTEYKKEFPFPSLYPPTVPRNVLSEVVASAEQTQFHCAETEKYAHVTFFFNGGQEAAFKNENRFMVSSPKVPTYDLEPEMSVRGVAEKLAEQVAEQKHAFIMCNFAPPGTLILKKFNKLEV